MTTESFTSSPRYTVSGTGPYAITHAFSDTDDMVVLVEQDGELITLTTGDYSIAPTVYAEDGDLTLTIGAAATYAGAELILLRKTRIEQGWVGSQSAREKGLERQLDRMSQHAQDIEHLMRRVPRLPLDSIVLDPSMPVPQAGYILIGRSDGTGFENGPAAPDIAAAQANAALAKAWAQSITAPDAADPTSKSSKTWAGGAEAWAENPTSPDGDPTSKSSKTWAGAAEVSAAAAAASAATLAGAVASVVANTAGVASARTHYATCGGTANAITLTTGLSLPSVLDRTQIRFRATVINTGATTFNTDGIGAVSCVTIDGATALPSGYIRTDVDTIATRVGAVWVVDRAVERGSNGNGEFIRWADGTQICWRVALALLAAGGAATFPAAFVAAPAFTANANLTTQTNTENVPRVVSPTLLTATGVSIFVFQAAYDNILTAPRIAGTVHFQATGDWY